MRGSHQVPLAYFPSEVLSEELGKLTPVLSSVVPSAPLQQAARIPAFGPTSQGAFHNL